MLITMSKKSSSEGLLIDPSLAKEMIKSIIEIGEKFSSNGGSLVIVTSPVIAIAPEEPVIANLSVCVPLVLVDIVKFLDH